MTIEIFRATQEHETVLRNLFEFYCYDFSEFSQEAFNDEGRFTPSRFMSRYWADENWRAYLLKVDAQWAGFVWVVKGTLFKESIPYPNEDHFLIDEFFIARKYRRRGLGEHLAKYAFDLYGGVWEVAEIPSNIPAQIFWRRILNRYTNGNFEEMTFETKTWGQQPIQVFRNTTDTPRRW